MAGGQMLVNMKMDIITYGAHSGLIVHQGVHHGPPRPPPSAYPQLIEYPTTPMPPAAITLGESPPAAVSWPAAGDVRPPSGADFRRPGTPVMPFDRPDSPPNEFIPPDQVALNIFHVPQETFHSPHRPQPKNSDQPTKSIIQHPVETLLDESVTTTTTVEVFRTRLDPENIDEYLILPPVPSPGLDRRPHVLRTIGPKYEKWSSTETLINDRNVAARPRRDSQKAVQWKEEVVDGTTILSPRSDRSQSPLLQRNTYYDSSYEEPPAYSRYPYMEEDDDDRYELPEARDQHELPAGNLEPRPPNVYDPNWLYKTYSAVKVPPPPPPPVVQPGTVVMVSQKSPPTTPLASPAASPTMHRARWSQQAARDRGRRSPSPAYSYAEPRKTYTQPVARDRERRSPSPAYSYTEPRKAYPHRVQRTPSPTIRKAQISPSESRNYHEKSYYPKEPAPKPRTRSTSSTLSTRSQDEIDNTTTQRPPQTAAIAPVPAPRSPVTLARRTVSEDRPPPTPLHRSSASLREERSNLPPSHHSPAAEHTRAPQSSHHSPRAERTKTPHGNHHSSAVGRTKAPQNSHHSPTTDRARTPQDHHHAPAVEKTKMPQVNQHSPAAVSIVTRSSTSASSYQTPASQSRSSTSPSAYQTPPPVSILKSPQASPAARRSSLPRASSPHHASSEKIFSMYTAANRSPNVSNDASDALELESLQGFLEEDRIPSCTLAESEDSLVSQLSLRADTSRSDRFVDALSEYGYAAISPGDRSVAAAKIVQRELVEKQIQEQQQQQQQQRRPIELSYRGGVQRLLAKKYPAPPQATMSTPQAPRVKMVEFDFEESPGLPLHPGSLYIHEKTEEWEETKEEETVVRQEFAARPVANQEFAAQPVANPPKLIVDSHRLYVQDLFTHPEE